MQTEIPENLERVGAMKKRCVLMADERRYLIYYTFEPIGTADSDAKSKTETPEKIAAAKGEN